MSRFKENCYLKYVLGALPPPVPVFFQQSNIPEIAFIGRSNVGKSSLLNALTYTKNLARTSNTPGKTQQVNFFIIEKFLTLVDLPGYGYAKISKGEHYKWSELIEYYFTNAVNLKTILILIDGRHGWKNIDIEAVKWVSSFNIPWSAVFTKADKKSKPFNLLEEELNTICAHKKLFLPLEYFYISSVTKIGLDQLRGYLKKVATT